MKAWGVLAQALEPFRSRCNIHEDSQDQPSETAQDTLTTNCSSSMPLIIAQESDKKIESLALRVSVASSGTLSLFWLLSSGCINVHHELLG
jgi:hypothetical protein